MKKNSLKSMEWILADAVLYMAEKNNVVALVAGETLTKISCALANTFSESGRVFLHRAYKLRSDYSESKADKLFNISLSAKNNISFASFMYHSEKSGIKRMDYLMTYQGDFICMNF